MANSNARHTELSAWLKTKLEGRIFNGPSGDFIYRSTIESIIPEARAANLYSKESGDADIRTSLMSNAKRRLKIDVVRG